MQPIPPLDGVGFEQVRLRYRRPPAQVDEHTVQVLQLAQLPFTGHVPDPLQIAVSIALPTHNCPLQLVIEYNRLVPTFFIVH